MKSFLYYIFVDTKFVKCLQNANPSHIPRPRSIIRLNYSTVNVD